MHLNPIRVRLLGSAGVDVYGRCAFYYSDASIQGAHRDSPGPGRPAPHRDEVIEKLGCLLPNFSFKTLALRESLKKTLCPPIDPPSCSWSCSWSWSWSCSSSPGDCGLACVGAARPPHIIAVQTG
jgi:hypothetical protein